MATQTNVPERPTPADDRADFAALVAQVETELESVKADNAALVDAMGPVIEHLRWVQERPQMADHAHRSGQRLRMEVSVPTARALLTATATPHPGAALLERMATARAAVERLNTEVMALHTWDQESPPDGGLYGEAAEIFARLRTALADVAIALESKR